MTPATVTVTPPKAIEHRHQANPMYWPVPVGSGTLVEIDYRKITSVLELLGGSAVNVTTGTVRAVSDALPNYVKEYLLPDGLGTLGSKVLISEPNLRYMNVSEYEACGMELPNPDKNGLGDLAHTAFERIVALMKNQPHTDVARFERFVGLTTEDFPMYPLGRKVFFDFDVDDESKDLVPASNGSAILVPERVHAIDNQLATVRAVGPAVEYVKPGDRIIARRTSAACNVEGHKYYYVEDESQLVSILRQAS